MIGGLKLACCQLISMNMRRSKTCTLQAVLGLHGIVVNCKMYIRQLFLTEDYKLSDKIAECRLACRLLSLPLLYSCSVYLLVHVKGNLERIPLFSSKSGHVTEKHVLTGHKHDKLGNQTLEETNNSYDTFHVFHLLAE